MQRETVAMDTPAIFATSLIETWDKSFVGLPAFKLILAHYHGGGPALPESHPAKDLKSLLAASHSLQS